MYLRQKKVEEVIGLRLDLLTLLEDTQLMRNWNLHQVEVEDIGLKLLLEMTMIPHHLKEEVIGLKLLLEMMMILQLLKEVVIGLKQGVMKE
jgi:hypothetical protein